MTEFNMHSLNRTTAPFTGRWGRVIRSSRSMYEVFHRQATWRPTSEHAALMRTFSTGLPSDNRRHKVFAFYREIKIHTFALWTYANEPVRGFLYFCFCCISWRGEKVPSDLNHFEMFRPISRVSSSHLHQSLDSVGFWTICRSEEESSLFFW